jgi:uncharacterized protein
MAHEMTLAEHALLVARLRERLTADAPVELIETHMSSVLLTGDDVYKLKKPVRFGFADFGTLAARRQFAEEELRINRRCAPSLYLGLVPVTGSVAEPRLGGAGTPIDWAVHLRRFAAEDRADLRLRAGRLSAAHIDRLADAIVQLHRAAGRAPADSDFGTPEQVARWMRANYAMAALLTDANMAHRFDEVRRWSEQAFARLAPLLSARRHAGFVRECHGDLHLANVALLDELPTPFDAIEFNPALRFIDVASDVAFPFMDLLDFDAAPLAWRLLDRWLSASGDYASLRLLRFYAVYRALVRAQVALLRAGQPGADVTDAATQAGRYLALAQRLTRAGPPRWLWIGGVSGSGKTTVAQHLLETLGAVRIRSDVERKRLFDLAPGTRADAALAQRLYSPAAHLATYRRLRALARLTMAGGFVPIVDAAFLRHAERDALRRAARHAGAEAIGLWCDVDPVIATARVTARLAAGGDASDATADVLARQLASVEAPQADEPVHRIDTGCDPSELARRVSAVVHEISRR